VSLDTHNLNLLSQDSYAPVGTTTGNRIIKNKKWTKLNTNIYICCYLNKPLRKNMHKSITIIFAILALFILSLCSACVSQSSPNQTSGQNVGLTQITLLSGPPLISFEEAKAKLIEYRSSELNEPVTVNSVYYMRSKDVDDSGNATGWTFGVNNGRESVFLVYDRTGWTTIANAMLPSEEIILDNVVSPGSLFSQNKAVLSGNPSPAIPEQRDIELQRGIYKLTITSGSTTRILMFNATTGALIT
jgi:hypothetical protein